MATDVSETHIRFVPFLYMGFFPSILTLPNLFLATTEDRVFGAVILTVSKLEAALKKTRVTCGVSVVMTDIYPHI